MQNCNIDLCKIASSIFTSRHQEYKMGGPGVTTGAYGMQFHEELSKIAVYIPSPIAYAGRIHFNPLLTKCINFAKNITTLCSKSLLNIGKPCFNVLTKFINDNVSKKTSLPVKQDLQLQDVVPSMHANTLTDVKPVNEQFLPSECLSNEINNKITNRNSKNIIPDTTGNRKPNNLNTPKNNKAKTPHCHL